MGSFEDYEKATVMPKASQVQQPSGLPSVDAPPKYKTPIGQAPPQVAPTNPPPQAEVSMLKFAEWFARLILFAIFALVCLGIWVAFKYLDTLQFEAPNKVEVEVNNQKAPKPPIIEPQAAQATQVMEVERIVEVEVEVPNPVNKELAQRVAWLESELEKATLEKTSDEKYADLLKYMVSQFYERPFASDEALRRLCFTTKNDDPQCWSVDRPEGFTMREPFIETNTLDVRRL